MTIPKRDNPIDLFREWYEMADHPGIHDRSATCLATADANGMPSARMVLLKAADENGFVFYTNLGSRKASELRENPQAALCFYWQPIGRQVRVQGAVSPVDDEEADQYFASRDRRSQIGAWASKQSAAMEGRFELEKRVAQFTAKFGVAKIPRPEFWSGFRIKPERMEFWKEGAFRLHDRVVYTRTGDDWETENLFP